MFYREDWDKIKEIYKVWWNKELDYPLLQVASPKEGIKDYEGYDGWGFLRYKSCPEKNIDLFEKDAVRLSLEENHSLTSG